MPDNFDVRWRQRFQNFRKAFAQLAKGVAVAQQRGLNEMEQQGLIQAFEFTHELAWNTLKDFLSARGSTANIYGSHGYDAGGVRRRVDRRWRGLDGNDRESQRHHAHLR